MSEPKTIEDVVEMNNRDMTLEARARKFEEEIKPLTEKWGVIPWAGLQSNQQMIAAVPLYKDLWAEEVKA